MNIEDILQTGPVVPVLSIKALEDAVPLANALVQGGVRVLEITLRTPVALEAIRLIANEVEGAIIGVGTIRTPADMQAAATAGAKFAVSPGLSDALCHCAGDYKQTMPLLPGIATASELMRACDAGFTALKFFPAKAAGGRDMLRAFAGPFAEVRFCPTGGITAGCASSYLALPNVLCVGGTWLAPAQYVQDKNWTQISQLAQQAAALKPLAS
ncbi:4-hydroxy-2-oxoglutarate aldolase @ 2-dehydro-3-deoxyphosphogluconate aldolase [hydrothermal vent metagenome]|uniref:2-dehydro-3-deoxy-phosphogluconate aldolase n=1 Tax=hydrothermal vent metagenome TaxID=652676 RepID=A0A3B0RMK0_9ZZZZ